MTEEVWINNHKLDVNPTDIQIITNRYSDSFNLTREDSPYAFVSPHGYTVVSMVLAFDITNPESIEQLISVYTQMDQFPFVWIKSNRLVGNISGFSQSIDGYSMYLVNTLTLRHTVDAQGVIFLNVEFYYFNHTPLCHSWSFIDIQPVIGQKKSFTQKQDKTEQQYNFVSGLKPSESGLFTSYFAKEIQRRLSLAANEIKTAPNSLIFSSAVTFFKFDYHRRTSHHHFFIIYLYQWETVTIFSKIARAIFCASKRFPFVVQCPKSPAKRSMK